MEYFYFGTLPIFNVMPHINVINVADTSLDEMIYVTHIKTKNYFLLKTYDFNTFICHVTEFEHLQDVIDLRIANGMLNTHVIVSNIEDKAEVLFQLHADTDLNMTVHFLNIKSQSDVDNFIVNNLCLLK